MPGIRLLCQPFYAQKSPTWWTTLCYKISLLSRLNLLHYFLDVVGLQVLDVVSSMRDLQGLEGIFGRLRDGYESLH